MTSTIITPASPIAPPIDAYRTPPQPDIPTFSSPARVRRTPSRLGTPIRKTFDIQLDSVSDGQPSAGLGSGRMPLRRSGSSTGFHTPSEGGLFGHRRQHSDTRSSIALEVVSNTAAGPSRLTKDDLDRAELDRQLAELGVDVDSDEDEVYDDAEDHSVRGYDVKRVDTRALEGGLMRSRSFDDGEDPDQEDEDEEMDDLGEGVEGAEERGLLERGMQRKRPSGSARRGRQGVEVDRGGKRSLIEILPALILSHPLSILPLLPLLPRSFSHDPSHPTTLPALLFLLVITLIAGLSVCAHVVTVYTARYLKVATWEEVLGRSLEVGWRIGSSGAGKERGRRGRGKGRVTELSGLGFGDTGESGQAEAESDVEDSLTERWVKYGIWSGQALQVLGSLGVIVGWLSAVHPILLPIFQQFFPTTTFLQSHFLWTLLASLILLPPIIPQRHKLEVSRYKEAFAVLVPVVVFLVIGRTVEVGKAGEEVADSVEKDGVAMEAPFSAGTAIFLMILLFTPHIHTLPIHGTVLRDSRSKYAFAWLGSTATLLVLALPYALVPYFLLANTQTDASNRSGVFDRFPRDVTDGWLNFARVCMVALLLTSVSQWMTNAREVCLRALGVEREGRAKAVRWLAGVMWAFVTLFASIGGWPARKLEDVGFICVMLTGWLIPAIVFVKVFHLSIPLAIVFPSAGAFASTPALPSLPTMGSRSGTPTTEELPLTTMTTAETAVEDDPALTALLARKERQLQKRRTGRRLWQDLIVLIGILPVGGFAVVWACCLLFGFVKG